MEEPTPIPSAAAPQLLEPLLGLHSAPNAAWLADAAATAAERGLGALYSLLYLEDESGRLAGVRPASNARARALSKLNQLLNGNVTALRLDSAELPELAKALEEGRATKVTQLRHVIPLDMNRDQLGEAQRQLGVSEVWLAPLYWNGGSAGFLLFLMAAAAPSSLGDAELLGRHVAVAFANLREKEAGRRRGEVDAVRWIYNERRFREELEQETRRARRHARPLSVLLLRVLNVEDLRAQYGRFLADRVLRQVADRLGDTMRDTDFLGASGEDGFAAVLVEADNAGAERAEERLSAGLHTMKLPHTELPDLQVQLAYATATMPQDGETSEELASAAEARLSSGRITWQDVQTA